MATIPRFRVTTIVAGCVGLALVALAFVSSGVRAALWSLAVVVVFGGIVKLLGRLRQRPFWQVVVLLVLSYVLFKWGVADLPPLFGAKSAPVPQSVLIQYMLTALVGVLIYVSDDEERWSRFKAPIIETLVSPKRRGLRSALLIVLPLLVGAAAYQRARPRVEAPIQLRSIHPAPPGQITFHGKTIQLTGLENPLRTPDSLEARARHGWQVYYQNCIPCHGDRLDGQGHFGHGFNPTPLPFDAGTIAQLTESFVFWRIAKGGPGLPREGTPWNSAMPVWEDFLSEDDIWSVIIFLYQQSGLHPRTWAEAGSGGGSP